LWQNGDARAQQKEVLFVNSDTRAVKYLVQFSIWDRWKKFEFYIWFTREVRTKKNFFKFL